MRHTLSFPTLVALASLALLGASWLSLGGSFYSSQPILYPVDGSVLVNGTPAENVNVAFHPLSGDPKVFCPVGRTDGNGVFHLASSAGSLGALAGEYKVTFVWPETSIEIDECECPDPLLHDRFKGLYARVEHSEYRVEVNGANHSLRFSLWRPRSDDPIP